MSVRVPTTDEVDTGFTTYAWELEKSSPGQYGEGSGYENYHTVCEGFRAWLAEIRRQAAAAGFAQGVARALAVTGVKTCPGDGLLTLIGNPYAAEAYRQERKEQ